MKIGKHQNKIVIIGLLLIMLAALAVRVWGIAYGDLVCYQHDEKIHLRTALKFYHGILNPRDIWSGENFLHVFYPWFSMYLVALFYRAYALARFSWQWGVFWVGQLFAFHPGAIPPVLRYIGEREALFLGRLTVALLGTATVLPVFAAGRRGWGRGVGLLAAALIAFNGYHVGNCHWMKNDVVALFFLALAFSSLVGIMRKGRTVDYAWAAVFSALAINSKQNGAPLLVVFLVAHCFREGEVPASFWRRLLDRKLLLFCLGFLMVFILSYPIFYLEPGYLFSNINTIAERSHSHALFGGLESWARPRSFIRVRLDNLVNFARFSSSMTSGMGIFVVIFGAAGIAYALAKRDRRLLLLVTFPLVYLVVAVLTAAPGIRYQDTVPLYPFFALLSAVLFRDFSRTVFRHRAAANLLMALAGLALLAPYVFAVARMDYGYWQLPTTDFATDWIQRNVPPGASIARESKTVNLGDDEYKQVKVRAIWGADVQAIKGAGVEYLVTSGQHEGRALEKTGLFGPEHTFGKTYISLAEEYDLSKAFDLGDIPYKPGGIKVYRLRPEGRPYGQDLNAGFIRHFQGDCSFTSPRICFLNERGECEGTANFVAAANHLPDRLLISPVRLEEIGVQLESGASPCTVKLTVGGEKIKADLGANDSRWFTVKPRTAFPFIQYSYRVKAERVEDGPCRVKILTDDLGLGLAGLEQGEWGKAETHLSRAAEAAPDDPYLLILRARALSEKGEKAAAGKCLSGLVGRFDGFRASLASLFAAADPPPPDTGVETLTGFPRQWLEERAGQTFRSDDLKTGTNKYGGTRWGAPGSLYLPEGRYFLRLYFAAVSPPPVGDFTVRLFRNGRPYHEWLVPGSEIGSAPREFVFLNESTGDEYYVMVESLSYTERRLLKVCIAPSLVSWLAEARKMIGETIVGK